MVNRWVLIHFNFFLCVLIIYEPESLLSIFNQFSSLYKQFLRTGSLHDNIEAMKTKKYAARTEENVESLTKRMTKNLFTSQRTTARHIALSQMTIQRMLSDLNLRPYKKERASTLV